MFKKLIDFLINYKRSAKIVGGFFSIWFILNILQANFTELFHDEAYYWMWAQDLAWGYAEHPPAVALMIWAGGFLPAELGVRFFAVILNTLALFWVYTLTDKKNPILFFAILLCMPLVHIAGILAVPDAPFIFFVCLYFFAFRKFLEKENLAHSLLLAFAVAGMLYSKYHGGMVLFFTLLSYPKLLINRYFWLVAFVSFALYFPHFQWALAHGFASLKFHLLERSKGAYRLEYTWSYLLGELLALGGIAGVYFVYLFFSLKKQVETTDYQWNKTLKWVSFGIFGFLFLLTFHQHVEANWAASAFIPFLLLTYQNLENQVDKQKVFYAIAIPTIIMMLVLRTYLVWDFLPKGVSNLRNDFHGWKEWAAQIEKLAQKNPVVFSNTYQMPAKYTFYTGNVAYSLNSFHYHRTQYDLIQIEEQIQGKDVYFVGGYKMNGEMDSIDTKTGKFFYSFIPNFHSFNKVSIDILPKGKESFTYKKGSIINIPILLKNPYPYPLYLDACPSFPTEFSYHFWKDGKYCNNYSRGYPGSSKGVIIKDSLQTSIPVKMPPEVGEYQLILSFQYKWIEGGYNGKFVKVKVTE
jgi:hypothetical protein